MNEWIRVKERMPEKGTEVLVFNGSYGVATYKHPHNVSDWWDGDGAWEGVTHWMPLPERPK